MCTQLNNTIWWCTCRTLDGWNFCLSTFYSGLKRAIFSLPQICDFGSARKYYRTTTKSIQGTYPWTAPEVTTFIAWLKTVHWFRTSGILNNTIQLLLRKWKELANCRVPQCDATNPHQSWSQLALILYVSVIQVVLLLLLLPPNSPAWAVHCLQLWQKNPCKCRPTLRDFDGIKVLIVL